MKKGGRFFGFGGFVHFTMKFASCDLFTGASPPSEMAASDYDILQYSQMKISGLIYLGT